MGSLALRIDWPSHCISKVFGEDGTFHGEVVDASRGKGDGEEDEVLYRIVYEDGDSEDFDKEELEEGLKLYQKEKKETKKPKREQAEIVVVEEEVKAVEKIDEGKGKRRSRSRVSYVEADEDSMDLDSDEEQIRQERKRRKPSKKTKKIAVSDDDDDGDDDATFRLRPGH